MYVFSSSTSLQESRKNRFVKLNNGANFMAIDEFNELINGKLKKMEDGSCELKGKQSLILPMADTCRRFVCPMLMGDERSIGRRRKISNTLNWKIVSSMIDEALEDCCWEMRHFGN